MNAINHTEAQAIHASAAPAALLEAADPSKNLILVPLSRLVSRPTGRNVRKTPRMSIPELAASIQRVGLLQNLIVTATADGERYEVVAGGRRLAALDADDEEKADALQEEGEHLGEQLQALEDSLQDYGEAVKAAAGAIVTVDRNGEAVIHRGLLREAEAKALRTLERLRQGFGSEADNDDEGEEADNAPKTAAMSDRLAQRLSAHRTAALQIEVARHPQVALAALVHGMVQTVLHGSYYGHDLPLGVKLTQQDRLEGMAPDWPESPAAVALRELQQVAGEALPEDSAELFAALLAKSQDELVRLLAVCVASTVDVVTLRATQHQPGAELAQAVTLDMAAWWQPTAEGYFQHVPKAAILEAVGEFAPEHVTRLAKLKKGDIASEAERLADGTGWMPAIFAAEATQQDAQNVAADKEAEVPEEATAVKDEQPQTEAIAA